MTAFSSAPSPRAAPPLVLAPMRGLTMLAFRRVFAAQLLQAGFSAAYSPFVSVSQGQVPGKSALADLTGAQPLPLVPQIIGKDPAAVAAAVRVFKDMGYERADLNAGCPFPMVRKKGRGSGLLKNPALLAKICEAGVEAAGAGRFSVKVRLGVEDPDALERDVMPVLNGFPLACVTIHPRTAVQMYSGAVDTARYFRAAAACANPVAFNGDLPDAIPAGGGGAGEVSAAAIAERWRAAYGGETLPAAFMCGRGFLRALGGRADSAELALAYMEYSARELPGPAPVLGRMKELLSYWRGEPSWGERWAAVKISRTLAELRFAISSRR